MKKFKSKDTLQFEPSSIEIRNPEWQPKKLQELVKRACAQLGCKGKVEAKLNKMLLSKPGGRMQKHRDSIQDQNTFATMFLQLPSVHQGAHLIIYNPDKTKTIHDFGESAKKAPYAKKAPAHYADAEHEVTEIKSGYRLALVYSLCWFNGNGISMLNSDVGLGKAMEILKNNGNITGVLLKHRYTPRSFQQNARATLSSCI